MEVVASPFRHVCIDNFLPGHYSAIAAWHFPRPASQDWKMPTNSHTQGKAVLTGTKYEKFDPQVRVVFDYLANEPMLRKLSGMFGIKGLMPDPYYSEGGYHRIGRGGFLDIHADFSHSDITGLERRLNIIIYLNSDWKDEWGGHLKLYDTNLQPSASYLPIFNRAVIFETSDTSYHGHPEPLTCPEGVFRKSMALYYYTLPRPERKKRAAYFPTDPNFIHKPTT